MLGRGDRGGIDGSEVGCRRLHAVWRHAALRSKSSWPKRKGDEGTRADPTKERQTVAQFMETWLAAARTSTRPQAWNGYERKRIVRLHIVPTLGRTKLGALRPDTIQKIYAEKDGVPGLLENEMA